jgi:uncharacterized protein (UPF0335 family)
MRPKSEGSGIGAAGHLSTGGPEVAENEAHPDILTAAAQGRLRTIIERIERVQSDIDALSADKSEIFAGAKGEGYDVKVLRKVIARRKQDKAKAQEEDAILDLYLSALGEV